MSDAPSHKQDKFIVRLPDGMRDRIKARADASGRSMNAEIVHALEVLFPDPSKPTPGFSFDPENKLTFGQERELVLEMLQVLRKHGVGNGEVD